MTHIKGEMAAQATYRAARGNPKQPWEMSRSEYKQYAEQMEWERVHGPGSKRPPRKPTRLEAAGKRTEWDATVDNWRRIEVQEAVDRGEKVPENVLREVGLKQNPGPVKRFLGGALRRGAWVLPYGEFEERVVKELVRRGRHKAGAPLEPEVRDVLRGMHQEAVRAYREGGPEAVDEALKEMRRGNPRYQQGPIKPESEVAGVMRTALEVHYSELGSPARNEKWEYGLPSGGRVIVRGPTTFEPTGWVVYEGELGRWQAIVRRSGFSIVGKPKRLSDLPKTNLGSPLENPVDWATVVAVGVLAGAVQGVVEPFVTRHVYRENPRQRNPQMLKRDRALQAVRELRAKGYTATLGRKHQIPGTIPTYEVDTNAPDELLGRLMWRLSATYRSDRIPDTEEEFDVRFPKSNPRQKLTDQLWGEHIPMPGFPQIVVTRGWAYQYLKRMGWDESKHGPGELDYTVFVPERTTEPLTDTAERDYWLNKPDVVEGYQRNPYGEPTFRKGRRWWSGQMGGTWATKKEAVKEAAEFAKEKGWDEVMIWTTGGGGKQDTFIVKVKRDS